MAQIPKLTVQSG